MKVLKNYPWDMTHLAKVPIILKEDSPDWKVAYSNYLSGKNPSVDPAWKEGVFFSAN